MRAATLCFLLAPVAPCLASPAAPVAARTPEACPRPTPGSVVPEPRDLRSRAGILQVDLSIRSVAEPDGSTRYCYLLADASEAPTLRLHPGDWLVLRLQDALAEPLDANATLSVSPGARPGTPPQSAPSLLPARAPKLLQGAMCRAQPQAAGDPCHSGMMSAVSTNLHFHGLTVPPLCHEDDVLKTSIQPTDPPFEYRFQIPSDEPPGLYWYHPHIHGFSSRQVEGGASGALIIEGIERANPALAGLPERVLVIRDQSLLNRQAAPSASEPVVPKMLLDRDGDSANNGTGFGKPAKDLSINFVPVPYPDYPPARIVMRPGEHQLWRLLNASSLTYLNLALIVNRRPQRLGIVAIDGVPLNVAKAYAQEDAAASVAWVDHIGVPPGARVEFLVAAPPDNVSGLLVTRSVDTGQGGENDPNRALAQILSSAAAPEPQARLPEAHAPLPPPSVPWLGTVAPARVRRLFFSEKLENPADPNSATSFYLTVDGQEPKPFDPAATLPDIVVRQGDVEDWIIENRSTELHAFHIHQLHFMLLEWSGTPVDEPFLRDTVNVPYFNGRMLQYPSVRVRMDFRDPNTIGTFVYHCHLLEHEDGGMMGRIRVEPRR
jgi:FtsP/CotA-like multicopper oxidase with cupredoxin domain